MRLLYSGPCLPPVETIHWRYGVLHTMGSSPASSDGRVLIVDDDEDIAQLVRECLADEGYGVTILRDVRIEAIQEAVARHEPNCILLDGGPGIGYGDSWATAALMTSRTPPIPTIMFTAHTGAV